MHLHPDLVRLLTRLFRVPRPRAEPPSLALLDYVGDSGPGEWIRASMTTFAESVASWVPGHYEAYARVFHPFESGDGRSLAGARWHEIAAAEGVDLGDPVAAATLSGASDSAFARVGSLPPAAIGPLVEHLRPATETPERCYFAVWEGFGGSAVPYSLEPKLELPHRRYHIFSGPIEAARTSFAAVWWDFQSANLWWPADRSWCVATEVDHAWTYVAGSRPYIRALLRDPRLEAVETTADARW